MKTYIFRVHYGTYPSQQLYAVKAKAPMLAMAIARRAIPTMRTSDQIEYVGEVHTELEGS